MIKLSRKTVYAPLSLGNLVEFMTMTRKAKLFCLRIRGNLRQIALHHR